MKKIFYLLLSIISFSSFAQNEVFRIDSLPPKGILLDKGWKFHAGDNPDFAKPDFDDSKWESIDPTKDIMDLDKLRNSTICWLRIPIYISDTTILKKLALVVKQTAATEFYLNGDLLEKFGSVNNNSSKSQAYDPMGQAIAFPVKKHKVNVLVVKFAFPDIFLVKNFYAPNYALRLTVCDVRNSRFIGEHVNQLSYRAHYSGMFKAGIFFLFCILHFGLFVLLPKQKANLYFGIYAFLSFCLMFIENYVTSYIYEVNLRNKIAIILYFIHPITLLAPFIAIYYLLNLKKNLQFWATVISCIIAIPFMIYPYFWGQIVGILMPSFFIGVGIPIVCWKAYKQGVMGAYGIFWAGITFICSFFIFTLMRVLDYKSSIRFLLNEITFDTAMLAVPAALSYYLILDFTTNKKQLELNFNEFQRLAKEKEGLLIKQNTELQAALLKGQTIERKRVALDLHDNLGTTLSALWLSVDTIDKSKMNEEEQEIHQNLRENLEKAYNDVRLLSHNLLPEEFEKQGLTIILQGFVRKMNKNSTIHFDLKIDEDFGRVDNKVEFELYSICLELVNNIIRHSKASEAKVELSRTENQIKLIISDNGIGTFNNESDGKGMKNVKARVESLNGVWNIDSKENEGTNSTIKIKI